MNLSENFKKQINLAIHLFEKAKDVNTDKEVIKYFLANGIPEFEAIEISLFLPIAFIRCLLPKVNWLDTYIDYGDNKKMVESKYSETISYQIILQVTEAYFEGSPNKETVLRISQQSAEFNLINNLLLNNPDLKLEEIKLSQTYIIR